MTKVSFGYQDVEPEEKTARVGDVFRSVASRYDLMNDAMSAGLHRLWKDRFVRRVKPRTGDRILDMAGGTGDIAFRLARAGAHVTVADINPAMLEVGMERAVKRHIDGLIWAEENAEKLSFADANFDAYTIAFGIRNVTDIPAALAEAHRVLKRGGRFFCLEFGIRHHLRQICASHRAENRQAPRGRCGKLPLSGRIDPPLSRHAVVRCIDRPGGIYPTQG